MTKKNKSFLLFSIVLIALVMLIGVFMYHNATAGNGLPVSDATPANTAYFSYAMQEVAEPITELEQLAPVIPGWLRTTIEAVFAILAIFFGIKYRAVGKALVMFIVGLDTFFKAKKPESPGGKAITEAEAREIWGKIIDSIGAAKPLLPAKWFKDQE